MEKPLNDNLRWDEQIIQNIINKYGLVNWLKERLIDYAEVVLDEDDEGHKRYEWVDKSHKCSTYDEIFELIIHPVDLEDTIKDDGTLNAITAGLDLLCQEIYDKIYDDAWDGALDELGNPNEREDY